MPRDRRMERLWRLLSPPDRAVMVLKGVKDNQAPDPAVLRTMPRPQGREVSDLLWLLAGVNHELVFAVSLLEQKLLRFEAQLSYLRVVALWADAAQTVSRLLRSAPIPITEAEHARLVATAEQELHSLDEAAEFVADCHYSRQGLDWSWMSESEEEAAWEALVAQCRGELEAAVAAGEVDGHGGQISDGSLYRWLDEPVIVGGDQGQPFDVRVDGAAALVEIELEQRRSALARAEWAPSPGIAYAYSPGLPEVWPLGDGPGQRPADESHREQVQAARQLLFSVWDEARAIEQVLDEIKDKLNGEDPALPQLRGYLDGLLRGWRDLCRVGEPYVGQVEPPEPGDEAIARVWSLAETWAQLSRSG